MRMVSSYIGPPRTASEFHCRLGRRASSAMAPGHTTTDGNAECVPPVMPYCLVFMVMLVFLLRVVWLVAAAMLNPPSDSCQLFSAETAKPLR